MPVLAWRNDADGYGFLNDWTFDTHERAALNALAQPLVPLVVGGLLPLFPEPATLTAISVASSTAATLGPLPSYGLCGGMAWTALDHWNAGVPIPRGANRGDQPARTGPTSGAIRDLIWRRLLDSLGPGGVLQKTLEWSLILNQVPSWLGGGAPGLMNRTRPEWDRVRAHIDAGRPSPIGLVCTNRNVWDQHQILVYGYENTGLDRGRLYIYENNNPADFGDDGHRTLDLDFRGSAPLAAVPSGPAGTLAGFFCSSYFADIPVGMSQKYGGFLSWTGDSHTWMVTDGVRLPVADPTELAALGGSAQDVRPTGSSFAPTTVRPRDGAVLRERSSTTPFLYAGGAPFALTDAAWVDRFGGVRRVRVVPDSTLSVFVGPPDEGTLLREWSDPRVWRIENSVRRWVRTPTELGKWGGFPSVRVVPDGALSAIAEGLPLPVDHVSEWHWSDLGRPPGVNVRRRMGAVTVQDATDQPQRPHVFVEGNDFNLWCLWSSGAEWSWLNMGKPSANLTELAGAVTVVDGEGRPQRPHVFIIGNDGNVWCRWSDGAAWHWMDMGRPPGVNARRGMGAVTVTDKVASTQPRPPQRGHVFVEGNDFNLWCLWSTGTEWRWLNMGKPSANLTELAGAVTVIDGPDKPQRPHVFIIGNDGNVWCRWSDGGAWHWADLGRPPGVNARRGMGAVTVRDAPDAPERSHVFVEGNDFNLWCLWSTGTEWRWLNMGKPAGVNLLESVGAVTVVDGPGRPQRPHVFVIGNDGNVWCRWSDGAAWHWSNMSRPPSANARLGMGAVTVMDKIGEPQRPHFFVEGNDSIAWAGWWG